MKPNIRAILSPSQIVSLLVLALGMAYTPTAWAATESWYGVPGTSVDTNWTTVANWGGFSGFGGNTPPQTYYNEVEFLGVGANAPGNTSVNNVLNATTGVAQMPIWELDYTPTNGNYTTLIAPGVTMNLNAGRGYLTVGADQLHTSSPATANAVETITIEGAGATLSMAGNLYVGQGSPTPLDTHNVTLDLSGLDNFVMTANGNYIYLASGVAARANGVLNLAKTNNIVLGNGIQMCNESSSSSNSQPVVINLGIANTITLGSSGNFNIGQTGVSTNGAIVEFNPAFLGGANPPTAVFSSSASNGRIGNLYVCNTSQAFASYALCNLSGGSVNALVSALQVGQSSSGIGSATGVLTFDMGTINASSAYVGRQQSSAGGMAVGTVNINSNSTYGAGATLVVGGTLSLAAVSGTLTPGTAAAININGGALSAGTITAGLGTSTIQSSQGAITLNGGAGTLAARLSYLGATNTTFNFPVISGTTNVVVTNLVTGGTTNIINISSVPPFPSYPAQIVLIKYSTLGGAGDNFGLGTLPAQCAGSLVNDTANSSIDLLLTSGPVSDVWDGAISGNWDTTTANWNSGASDYADGNFVVFPDGATTGTVSLSGTVQPGGITVTNNTLSYTFNGGGAIAGATSLIKSGNSTLILDNSGNNTFSGGVNVNGGVLQVGNSDTSGNLPVGTVANAGVLIFDRQDNITEGDNISGAGALVQAGGGSLLLNGANSFTGLVVVTNNSTLQQGSGSAAGVGTSSLTIASGSTLDANGYACNKPIVVSGTGVGGNGAIINSGGAIYGLATNVTLAGDTTFNIPSSGRWDLGTAAAGNVLSTGGHAYNLTINASGYFQWENLAVDANLAAINLNSGTFGMVGSTTFGNPASNLVVAASASVDLYGSAVYLNKGMDLQDGTINNDSGNNKMNGALTLEPGYCTFNMANNTTLTMSNVISGSGVFYQSGGNGTNTLTGNSPNFTGGILLYNGGLTLNGLIGCGITSELGTVLAGSGVASNLVDVSGVFLPGGPNAAGTFTAAGGLTLETSATMTMDLGSTTAIGGGTNDLVNVVGDLTVSGNNITINPIKGTLANGTYTLFTYTGNLNGSFGTASTPSSSRYSFSIDTSVPHQVNLIVVGVPNLLVWNNGANNSQWDVTISFNWTNLTTHVEDQFYAADTAVLDDSILTAQYLSTNLVIPAGTGVIPGLLTNNSTANYAISGSGKISGGANIVKQGTSTLTVDTTNDFTGSVIIQGGTLKAGCPSSLGGASGTVYVTNSATLDLIYSLASKPLVISGAAWARLSITIQMAPPFMTAPAACSMWRWPEMPPLAARTGWISAKSAPARGS